MTDARLNWINNFPIQTRKRNLRMKLFQLTSVKLSLVGFYDISTLVGYLIPNPVHAYMLNKHDLLTHFVDNIFKGTRLLFFFSTQLNGFKYFYQIRIILFFINHLFAHSKIVSSIAL